MRTLTLKCSVVSGKRPQLTLQDVQIDLKKKSGTTSWSKSAPVTLGDSLKIDASFVGIEDSPWSIDITMDCEAGQSPARIFHDEGNIPDGGGQGISVMKPVPADPCAKLQDATATSNFSIAVPEVILGKQAPANPAPKKTPGKRAVAKKVPKKRTNS